MSYTKTSIAEFSRQLGEGQVPLCIDVRSPEEFAPMHCVGSVNLPLQDIDILSVESLLRDYGLGEGDRVYLMCAMGKRSAMAAQKLAPDVKCSLCVVEGGAQDLPVSQRASL